MWCCLQTCPSDKRHGPCSTHPVKPIVPEYVVVKVRSDHYCPKDTALPRVCS